jgi:uncharacterized protein
MQQASHRMLPDGRRLHLHHGPIDLIVEAWGTPGEVTASRAQAVARFETILTELVGELPLLRRPVGDACELQGTTARRMWRASAGHLPRFVTPMAAVAGAVADEVLAAMTGGRDLRRAYVNNGGDIALHLAPPARSRESGPIVPFCAPSELTSSGLTRASTAEAAMPERCPVGPRVKREDVTWNGGAERISSGPDESFRIGLVVDPGDPRMPGAVEVSHDMPVRGIATSGRHGRSLSLGIADSVTVLAETAAGADAAATLIANAVDLPGHGSVRRAPAGSLDPDSDLGDRLVTVDVGALNAAEVETALAAGVDAAEGMIEDGLLFAAVLVLGQTVRLVGYPGADAPQTQQRENRIDA